MKANHDNIRYMQNADACSLWHKMAPLSSKATSLYIMFVPRVKDVRMQANNMQYINIASASADKLEGRQRNLL